MNQQRNDFQKQSRKFVNEYVFSGLDSSSSFDTIMLLEELASEGRTIVCTIHQPSSTVYNIFKHIYVLNGGLCEYQGTPTNTVAYLKSVGLDCPAYHNPADFRMFETLT